MGQADVTLNDRGKPAAAPAHSATLGTLALASIGVVYGDIGTSPLYAFREAMVATKITFS